MLRKEVTISQVDVLFSAGLYPIEFLFYYRETFNTTRLRSALRKTAAAFWPVFGAYGNGRIVYDKFREEDFYAEAAEDLVFDGQETAALEQEICPRFRLPGLEKLFFLKAIRLKKGMALIAKMSHLAGDGYSYFYFLSVLAALSRPAAVPLKSMVIRIFSRPHHRRTALKDFSFRGIGTEPAHPGDQFAVETDEIPRTEVRSIIHEAASADQVRISTNDVLSALAMKKIVGRQAEFPGREVGLTIPIDIRRKVSEYGRKFFGNGLMFHTIKLDRESAASLPAKEIAIQLRKSMPAVSKETYVNYLTGLEDVFASGRAEKLGPFDPESGVLVTNLSRMPVEKLDFGSGPPDLIIPLTTGRNAAAILAKKENFVLRYAC